MMEAYLPGILSAAWLGVLTSVSPCPLASNIAAISYIGNRVESPRHVLLSGLLYTAGRMVAYLALGVIIVAGLLSVPKLSFFLQLYMNVALGPLLVVVGLFLLGAIRFSFPGAGLAGRLQGRVERLGIWGAGVMGIVFALSFCPVSAALFFGSLLPLALLHESRVVIPTVYGVGTALPVFAFALLVAMGTRYVGLVFNRLTAVEKWARRVTAVIFIGVGIYYSLIYIFGLPL